MENPKKYMTRFVISEDGIVKHKPLGIEYQFYNAIKTGDMDYVNRNCEENEFLKLEKTGTLSYNSLTNIKYHFVVTAAMVTRFCVEGGMAPEQALKLSDHYILKMDGCKTAEGVSEVHHEMVKDFTGKMVMLKKHNIESKPIDQCVDYIHSNINKRITIADLSEYTGLSANYLSRAFKKNLGIPLSDYIRQMKVERAAHLLRYSETPIIEISDYLSFSSQSHFIQVFESYMGLTPKKYRAKYYKAIW